MDENKRDKRIEEIGSQILKFSRNELMVGLRFMDLALCKLKYKPEDLESTSTDGENLYYNPWYLFKLYKEDSAQLNHAYLHSILHCVFYHPFVDKTIDRRLWDIACDIAVESVIDELGMKKLETPKSPLIKAELTNLAAKYGKITAERLYRKFSNAKMDDKEVIRLQNLFLVDEHFVWYMEKQEKDSKTGSGGSGGGAEKTEAKGSAAGAAASGSGTGAGGSAAKADMSGESTLEEWKKISESIKIDLETSSKEWGDTAANLKQNVAEVNREKYDYSDFLRKFAVLGEEMQINDDEFDYIFYTYGIELYKNMPLIEPLEYKEVKKVKEFVIAIDTSGSVQGELVQKFINKTYNILMQQENFFTKINVHIVQCDAEIQRDDKITSKEEFDEFIKRMELSGFGGTDFRPVFDYVDALIHKGEFENLKGLIYFTDGYGTFPDKKPPYDAAFVFVDNEYGQPQIPVWAIKLVLAEDEI